MLTELDHCILGIIWRGGPTSAYGVRGHFAKSSTVAWSSSTGTVYPAIRRLVVAGLLDAGSRTGPRKSQLLTLTKAGKIALNAWLTHVPLDLGSPTLDPIRARVQFLAALGESKRAKVLAMYGEVTEGMIRELELKARMPARTVVEKFERLGALGALMELRARRDWLDRIETELGEDR